MIKMTAKKRFMNGGTLINAGENFSVSNELIAHEFINRDLARKQLHQDKSHAPSEVKTEATVANYLDYGAKTVPELKELAKAKNITGYSSMNKGQLIEILENEK